MPLWKRASDPEAYTAPSKSRSAPGASRSCLLQSARQSSQGLTPRPQEVLYGFETAAWHLQKAPKPLKVPESPRVRQESCVLQSARQGFQGLSFQGLVQKAPTQPQLRSPNTFSTVFETAAPKPLKVPESPRVRQESCVLQSARQGFQGLSFQGLVQKAPTQKPQLRSPNTFSTVFETAA